MGNRTIYRKRETTALHVFRLTDDGELWWIVGTDADAALVTAREEYEIPPTEEEPALAVDRELAATFGEDDDVPPVTATLVPDDEMLSVGYPDGIEGELPEGAEILEDRMTVRATAAAWARLAGEGALLGGTSV
jgi:hypothetical protein